MRPNSEGPGRGGAGQRTRRRTRFAGLIAGLVAAILLAAGCSSSSSSGSGGTASASAAATPRRRARAGNGRLTRLPARPGLSLLAVTVVPSTTSLPVSFDPAIPVRSR